MWGARRNDATLMGVASSTALAQFVFVAASFAALTACYVDSDFSVLNVFQNSHSTMPLIYKFTSVWGNHEGSMLLWVLILALFGALVALFGANLPDTLRANVLAVQAWIASAFYLFILMSSNPFLRVAQAPAEGRDLNPILQDIGLAVHPPMLYLGYVGFSISFAFAIAALIDVQGVRPSATRSVTWRSMRVSASHPCAGRSCWRRRRRAPSVPEACVDPARSPVAPMSMWIAGGLVEERHGLVAADRARPSTDGGVLAARGEVGPQRRLAVERDGLEQRRPGPARASPGSAGLARAALAAGERRAPSSMASATSRARSRRPRRWRGAPRLAAPLAGREQVADRRRLDPRRLAMFRAAVARPGPRAAPPARRTAVGAEGSGAARQPLCARGRWAAAVAVSPRWRAMVARTAWP